MLKGLDMSEISIRDDNGKLYVFDTETQEWVFHREYRGVAPDSSTQARFIAKLAKANEKLVAEVKTLMKVKNDNTNE